MVALPAEQQRELNDEGRREAQAANAGRRGADWNASGRPAGRSKQRAERTIPGTTGTNAAPTIGYSAEFVNAGFGLTVPANPA